MEAGEIARVVIATVIVGLAAPLAFYVVGRSKASPPRRASGGQGGRSSYPVALCAQGGTTTALRQPALVGTRFPTQTTIVIRPIDRPYWDLQHWRREGDRLVGFYRTPRGSFEGYIRYPESPRPEFYIVNPPQELRQHLHWICFHSIGGDSYSIHFSPAPGNPDAGILEVEKVLGEALTGRGRRNA